LVASECSGVVVEDVVVDEDKKTSELTVVYIPLERVPLSCSTATKWGAITNLQCPHNRALPKVAVGN
jgi:hypothetical protein